MQATVRFFDASSRSGTVLLDDGLEVPFDGGALAGTEIRLLRLGQRVRVRLAPDGSHVRALALATFDLP